MRTNKKQNQLIAFFGIEGSNSYLAAKTCFHSQEVLISCKSTEEVFSSVLKGECSDGIVPIENSTTGSIAETYDCLIKNRKEIGIVGETYIHIHHYLMGIGDMFPSRNAKKVLYSHPQGFVQSSWFLEKLKNVEMIHTSDTATAAKIVHELNKPENFAIANKISAQLYDLEIQSPPIEDNAANFTRFVILSRLKKKRGNKVSLVFGVKHIPGSLVAALSVFAQFGLNLTKIESRPVVSKKWEYLFLVDLELNSTIHLKHALTNLAKCTYFNHILGIYNKGDTYES